MYKVEMFLILVVLALTGVTFYEVFQVCAITQEVVYKSLQ